MPTETLPGRRAPSRPLALLGLLAASTVIGVGTASAQAQDCSIAGQNNFVAGALREFYLWYQELPATDPALFGSPEAYLEAVRFRPLDETFSFITTQEVSDAFYSASQFVGIGFGSQQTSATELRVSQVYPDSPASEAGLLRGDFVIAVDGRPMEELLATGQLAAALGPSTIGHTLELAWRRPNGREQRQTVTKRVVTIPTVSQAEVLSVDGRPVGYLHLRNFVEPSIAALDSAFEKFRQAGVVDVVLDLRYNGGGLISVATHLGSLIGGLRTNTQVFVELVHNDKNTARNKSERFGDPPATLDLPRLVVIATRASASSSELVINGLKPFMPVTVVGAPTYGKPVGQYGFEFCDKVLFPVAFQNVNALGDGNYFDGIPVDCPADDELGRPLAHPDEDSLEEALHFLRTGACRAEPETLRTFRLEHRTDQPPIQTGFQQILNAW